jgi:deoxyribonuclease-1
MNNNYKIIVAILFIALLSINLNASSFSQSKKILLNKIYFDNQYTFYCGNPYKIDDVKGKDKALIIKDKKFYSPRNDSFFSFLDNNERAKIVEWEHIMPAENFGKHLPCWKEGGRKACAKDETFKTMESDMHNLVPAIGEVNNDRSNFKYGAKLPSIGQYGKCEFEVDFEAKRAYPRGEIRGDIARIYFYMSEKYNIKLSKQERKMMEVWDKEDPISDWERIKNKRVEEIQGNSNKFIE